FLLVYIGVLLHYFRNNKDYQFVAGCIVIGLFGLIFMTYSRSSLLGFAFGSLVVAALNAKTIFKKYKVQAIIVLIPFLFVGGFFYFKYNGSMDSLITRTGSSKGHFERMATGVKRFAEKPWGNGLATSGPASRSIYDTSMKEKEDYYIPESWFIQQLVEGGIVGFLLFGFIILFIFIELYKKSQFVLGSFIAVLSMNMLLHTFEAMYVSLALFIIIGMIIGEKKGKRQIVN
ncbi:MAG: O-antigen ligase family protein, partial [Candidatus Gracilibacteria bacterium]|nr:O-antigen ligase family protein [Candidatus Gracilibacteria bacterium]